MIGELLDSEDLLLHDAHQKRWPPRRLNQGTNRGLGVGAQYHRIIHDYPPRRIQPWLVENPQTLGNGSIPQQLMTRESAGAGMSTVERKRSSQRRSDWSAPADAANHRPVTQRAAVVLIGNKCTLNRLTLLGP